MLQLEKLIALAGLARSMYGRWVLQQLVSHAIVVAGLIIVSSIMVSVMLVGGSYVAYHALLNNGNTPEQALIIIGAVMSFITALLVYRTLESVRQLRHLPRQLIKEKSPVTLRAGEVVDSFIDGLLAK